MEPSFDVGTLLSQCEKNLNGRDTSAEAKKLFSLVICTGGTRLKRKMFIASSVEF
jgi:hypothetical protein